MTFSKKTSLLLVDILRAISLLLRAELSSCIRSPVSTPQSALPVIYLIYKVTLIFKAAAVTFPRSSTSKTLLETSSIDSLRPPFTLKQAKQEIKNCLQTQSLQEQKKRLHYCIFNLYVAVD